ncbi:MAG: hypothetical protein HY897_02460 [Deltaproteobacteria bacterium]|nr:hypothetical protein [Deltaproteobacteria bacterium]
MERKPNCWEFKKCGREPGGNKVSKLGVCPAAVDERGEGANGGSESGRICWVTAGTFCGGKVQGSFAQKRESCEACDFFVAVKKEEGDAFVFLPSWLQEGGGA